MSTANHIWLNGQPAQSISTLDRGLAYGHGVFETIRVFNGSTPLLAYHLQRLEKGAQTLSIDCDCEVIAEQLAGFLAEQTDTGIVKIIVTAGIGGRGYQLPGQASGHPFSGNTACNVILQWHPLPAAVKTPLTVRVCHHQLAENSALAGIKHLNRLDQVLARAEWSDPAIHEGIVLDQQQRVVEAVASNVFARIGGQWVTPVLSRCGVAGVMRSLIMQQLCRTQEMDVIEKDLSLDELIGAQEVFLCNSVLGIRPVGHIIASADCPAVHWPVGDWTAKLQRTLRELYPCYE